MAGIKNSLMNFVRVFTQHPMCLANGFVAAAVAGIEQTFEELVFKCPEKQGNKLYSLVSCFAPAALLWIVGILGSNLAWRLCQGFNSRQKGERDCSCGNFCMILGRAVIIPLVWILIVLTDGDMYACYFWNPDDDEWNKENKSESQLIGWGYFGICLLLGLIVVFTYRCCDSRTYFSHIYANKLKRAERLQFEKLLKVRAEKDAERYVGALMLGCNEFSAEEWETISRENTEAGMVKKSIRPGGKDKVIQFQSPVQQFLFLEGKELLERYDEQQAANNQTEDPATPVPGASVNQQEHNSAPPTVPVIINE